MNLSSCTRPERKEETILEFLLQKLAFPIDDSDVDVVHPGMVGRGETDIQVAGVIILDLFEGVAKLLASRFWTGTSQAFD